MGKDGGWGTHQYELADRGIALKVCVCGEGTVCGF